MNQTSQTKQSAKAVHVPVVVRGMAEKVRKNSSATWTRLRNRTMLNLFQDAVRSVPAYKDFIQKHNVLPENVVTVADFEQLPVTSKADYLKKYPLADLCWDGNLARAAIFSSTSGSTGKPFYFQRTSNLEEQYSVLAELFLSNAANPPSKDNPTLVIIGFGMGVWIGGTLTYRAFDIASRRACPVSILPVGVNKSEILKALKDLAPSFKQTILIGYPPFVKDVLDEAEFEGVEIKKLNLRLMFAAEAFTERFRDYLAEKIDLRNVYCDTLNIYGTADLGAMAFETPTAILIRRLSMQHKELYADLFGGVEKTPTLAQYNPAYASFEAPNGEILITGYGGMPLIRYAVGDHGGVHTFDEVKRLFKKRGIDLEMEAQKANVPLYQLPFVYVYARVDLSAKLYGAIVYPEHVRSALEEAEMQKLVTGKFSMQTISTEAHEQSLEINIELRRGITGTAKLEEKIKSRIIEHLLEKNSEYRNNHRELGQRVLPVVVLWPQGDPTYFTPGIKQKWVLKSTPENKN